VIPEPGLLIAVGSGAGFGAAIVLLVAGLRGVRVDATRPPPRWRASLRRLRSPAVSLRLGAAGAVGVLILILTRWPVAAAGIAALIVAWPYLFGGARAEQDAIARLEALVIWSESLRDTVAANASLEQAITASTQRAPVLIQSALQRLGGQLRAQTPVEAALRALAADLDDPAADMVIAALILNVRRRGDRLALVLSGLAGTAREELDLRRRVNAGRAGLRRAVQIIVVITVAIAAYLTLFGGPYLQPYDRPAGQLALTLVIALFTAGFAWMRHLSADQDSAPFLERPGRPPDPAQPRIVAALTGLPAYQGTSAAPAHSGGRPSRPRRGTS
jgi:tight adherence protein B